MDNACISPPQRRNVSLTDTLWFVVTSVDEEITSTMGSSFKTKYSFKANASIWVEKGIITYKVLISYNVILMGI